MTIQSQLDQVLALSEKATPGPWCACNQDNGGCICGGVHSVSEDIGVAGTGSVLEELFCDNREEDADKIAANAVLIASAVNFLRQHGPAIRAAVGGGAVNVDAEARRLFELNSAGWAVKARWDELHPQTRELWHAHALKSLNPPATVDVGAIRKALNDIREAVTQEPEDKFGYSQVDHGSGIPRAYSVRENILCTIDNRLAALIGKEA